MHDFALPELGKVAPYGIYDIAANVGWINLDITSDTAAFAVESIRRWWHELGQPRYPDAERLLITADCGGSNGVRVRLWKTELQTPCRNARSCCEGDESKRPAGRRSPRISCGRWSCRWQARP